MMQAAEVLPFFQIKKSTWNENFKTLNPKAILIALCLPLLGSTDSEEKNGTTRQEKCRVSLTVRNHSHYGI